MRILLADDHALFSAGLEMILKEIVFPACEVDQVYSWFEASAVLETKKFDLILTDLFMPGESDWKVALAQLVRTAKDIPVCVISSSASRENIHKVFELGCKGYLHKSFTPQMLSSALRNISDGRNFFPSATDLKMAVKPATRNFSLVTARQREILILVGEGKSNLQIADWLNLQESTVKRHVYNICKTLQVRSRGEAVHVARRLGILESA